MPTPEPIALIVNARARRGEAWFDEAKTRLREAGVPVQSEILVAESRHFDAAIQDAIKGSAETIVVGGGDGTLAIAAKKLARERKTLGVLPLGTGNAFARDLGIRTDLTHAVEVIANGNVGKVDYGVANEHIFLNLASLGLTTLVARRLRHAPKAVLGPIAYAIPIFQALRLIRPFEASLRFEGDEATVRTYQVVVGNGRFHAGPFPVAPDASIDSGEFLVYAVQAEGKGVLFKYMLGVLLGRQTELENVHVWRKPEVRIETRPERRVVLDGEIVSDVPRDFKVVPRGLKVLMPG
ncbi:MAG TPA: YegS/Rv2252/BmrU family lipid kinase [Fimbriimonadaceae bacterium]|nr:YegS/Rv2252/BmrU family lipid kinase [Fimbriimonadaceae bacterium]